MCQILSKLYSLRIKLVKVGNFVHIAPCESLSIQIFAYSKLKVGRNLLCSLLVNVLFHVEHIGFE